MAAFREKAVAQGFSADEVERWAAVARPCLRLNLGGDGPVVGQFGGPLLLPADAPDPSHPFVASLDLAALPAEAAGLPLPADGHLLLFAFPEDDDCDGNVGSAVHVPAGTAVTERDRYVSWWADEDDYGDMIEQYPQGPLRAAADVSLPHFCDDAFTVGLWDDSKWPPYSAALIELLREARDDASDWGTLQIGGCASEEVVDLHDPIESVISTALRAREAGEVDGEVSEHFADWVLLADWHTDIEGWEGATVHWAVQREDLIARRFDRVFVTRYWNP
ncbi:protein of unknown function [Lentzea waywayandensis]|uniref:DUF1963 domain-containing protein n=1 Tax=Lentzea waywayandensis TaxID=84724 RepID=A0A1I6DBV1_9PSEU|nr:protein of unknown function [Lentzea waywayandensis]